MAATATISNNAIMVPFTVPSGSKQVFLGVIGTSGAQTQLAVVLTSSNSGSSYTWKVTLDKNDSVSGPSKGQNPLNLAVADSVPYIGLISSSNYPVPYALTQRVNDAGTPWAAGFIGFQIGTLNTTTNVATPQMTVNYAQLGRSASVGSDFSTSIYQVSATPPVTLGTPLTPSGGTPTVPSTPFWTTAKIIALVIAGVVGLVAAFFVFRYVRTGKFKL